MTGEQPEFIPQIPQPTTTGPVLVELASQILAIHGRMLDMQARMWEIAASPAVIFQRSPRTGRGEEAKPNPARCVCSPFNKGPTPDAK